MKIVISILVVIVFSGCSVMKDAGSAYLTEKKLDEKVTVMCYDYFDKKECPIRTVQADIDVFRFIPSFSRFCFGFVGYEDRMPEGMTCVKKNIIK